MTGTKPADVTGFNVQHERLALSGSRLGDIAGEIGGGLAQFRSTLDGMMAQGAPWGNDSVGQAFANQFLPVAGRMLNAVTSYQNQVAYAGQHLPAAARDYHQTDLANAKAFRQAAADHKTVG
jgi:hypothetical protein